MRLYTLYTLISPQFCKFNCEPQDEYSRCCNVAFRLPIENIPKKNYISKFLHFHTFSSQIKPN